MQFSRIIIAALAVAAIAAPTAAARPIDTPPQVGASTQTCSRPSTCETDAKDRAQAAVPVPDRRAGAFSDMRSSVATLLANERAEQRLLPGPPAMPMDPKPITSPATVAGNADDDDGIDWSTIAIGVGLTFVALGAVTGVAYLVRDKQRPRVA
jgi:hypothetical protein